MLIINAEQKAILEQATLRRFENRIFSHLRGFFPNNVRALGEADTRDAVRYGIERAKRYGIVAEQDVCIYIDLMFLFGRDFDREQPWAQAILDDRKRLNPRARADVLLHTAMQQPSAAARGIACPERG